MSDEELVTNKVYLSILPFFTEPAYVWFCEAADKKSHMASDVYLTVEEMVDDALLIHGTDLMDREKYTVSSMGQEIADAFELAYTKLAETEKLE